MREVHDFAGYDHAIEEETLTFSEMDRVKKQLEGAAPAFDGPIVRMQQFNSNYKYYFDDDCWVLIRMSGTEPVVRVFAEMKSADESDGQISAVKKFLSA